MVRNDYTVSIQWVVKTLQCSLPLWKANRITRLIKEIKENRRKGLGVPLGPKVRRLRVWGSEGSKTSNITQHHKTLQDRRSVSNSKVQRLRKLFSGFPLQWHHVITLNLCPKGNCSHVRCATQVRPWHDKSHARKPTCRHWPAGVICCDIFFKQKRFSKCHASHVILKRDKFFSTLWDSVPHMVFSY